MISIIEGSKHKEKCSKNKCPYMSKSKGIIPTIYGNVDHKVHNYQMVLLKRLKISGFFRSFIHYNKY